MYVPRIPTEYGHDRLDADNSEGTSFPAAMMWVYGLNMGMFFVFFVYQIFS